MQDWLINITILIFWSIQWLHCQSIDLTPAEAYVDLYTSSTFTCAFRGYDEVIGTRWSIRNKATPAIVRHQDGTCTGMGIFADDTIYRVGCPSVKSFNVTILNVQPADLNSEWYCFDNDRSSNSFTIIENVPVANVLLSLLEASSGLMKEHTRQTIKCKTSTGRPQPKVSWYLNETTRSVIHKINVNATTRIIPSTESGLVAVKSTLQFYPNRSINTWVLYCKGWTNKESRSVHSNKISLNITYHPNHPPEIDGSEDGKKYRLIESEVGTLSCSVYGGNPLPRLTWNCYNNTQTSDTVDGKAVNRNVTLIGIRGQTSCSCISNHSLTETIQSTSISIDVLFPTEIKTVSLSLKSTEEIVVINETDEASLACIAESNPSSNLSIQNPKGDYISEVSNSNIARHTLRNTSYENAGEYTCTGRNYYTRDSPAISHLILIIKCPSRPYSGDTSFMKVTKVLHGDVTLIFSAFKYLDEPNKTVFIWFKEKDQISDNGFKYTIRSEELQTNLSIRNTTKQDFGFYRVSVRNSVREYVHYYELNAEATTHSPTEAVCSTNTGAFFGVGAGTFLTTIVMVIYLFIGYKQLKKLRFVRRKSYKQKDGNNKHQLSVAEESQATSAYTDLDGNKKEVNEYDAVNVQRTSFGQQDMQTQGPSEYIEMKDTRDPTKETIDYINIKI